MANHHRDVEDLPESRALHRFIRKELQQPEILENVFLRGGPLDFNNHLVARLQRGPMNLSDRAGRQGHGIYAFEYVLPGHA